MTYTTKINGATIWIELRGSNTAVARFHDGTKARFMAVQDVRIRHAYSRLHRRIEAALGKAA